MGRTTRHQKFVKSEKSKIKLKGKKELPKGTNVTNTAFKIKKIVIRDQLKARDEERGGRAGIRELLNRLGHFNAGSRSDALSGLRELLARGEGGAQLGDLIMGVCPLALDKEKLVRRESLKVLQQLLLLCGSEAVTPFYVTLSGFLRCAMTHLHQGVREDSLLLLEVLLLHAPACLRSPHQQAMLLPAFLDMVSRLRADSRPGRTLTLNMSGRQSAVRWRTSVLTGLMKFLELGTRVDADLHEPSLAPPPLLHSFCAKTESAFPLRLRCSAPIVLLGFRSGSQATKVNEETPLIHVGALAPLLWESWAEVRPLAGAPLSIEARSTLTSITRIISVLLRHKNTKQKFSMCHGEDFAKLFVEGIPYQAATSIKNKGLLTNDTSDMNCCLENLAVCHCYLLLGRDDVKVLKHIIQYLKQHINLLASNDTCRSSLSGCVHALLLLPSCQSLLEDLLLGLVSMYVSASNCLSTRLCVLSCLSSISFSGGSLWQISWAEALVSSLSISGPLPPSLLSALTSLSIQSPVLLENALRGHLPALVRRLPSESSEDPVLPPLLALLYRVPRWDNESLDILQERLDTCKSLKTKQHLVEVLRLKTQGMFCG